MEDEDKSFRELSDDELLQVVGGSKTSAHDARERRNKGPWG